MMQTGERRQLTAVSQWPASRVKRLPHLLLLLLLLLLLDY
jgi:hypothetical protein